MIQRKSPASVDLLNLSAFLAPERLPLELLTKAGSQLGSKLEDALDGADEDELVLDDLLLPLTRYSLVHRQRQTNSYDVHRLVQAVTRQNLDETQRLIWAERAVRAVSQAFPEVAFENWPACERLLSHALVCVQHIATESFQFDAAAHLLSQLGDYLYCRAHYKLAEPILARALTLWESLRGIDHLIVATRCNFLAMLYHDLEHYAEAETLYNRALHIREQCNGLEHPDVAQALTNLATLYKDQGRYADAEPLYQRALTINETMLGAEHHETALTLNNMATLLHHQGRLSEMEPLYRRAYAIMEKTLGSEHPHTAMVLNNLAELYEEMERYVEAGALYRRSLAIAEKTLGPGALLYRLQYNAPGSPA